MSLDKPLAGKVGIVTGVANKRSIAFGIAKALHEAGTWQSPAYSVVILPFLLPKGNHLFSFPWKANPG